MSAAAAGEAGPAPSAAPRIAVLMTCHNRRALTLRCLAALTPQPLFRAEDLYLVDDGSGDGTGEAVRAAVLGATPIAGDGSLFWNGGMRLAWRHAAAAGVAYEYFLWLNDDVELYPDALARLVADARQVTEAGAVVVGGTMVDPRTGAVTYGGQSSATPARPLRLRLVTPRETPQPVDTISGNAVLVSAAAYARLGSLDPRYVHIFGDLDYGLRARAAGIAVVAGSGVTGACEANAPAGTSLDASLSRARRFGLQWAEARKIHARDWRAFVRRFSGLGPLSFLYRVSPYLRILRSR